MARFYPLIYPKMEFFSLIFFGERVANDTVLKKCVSSKVLIFV